MRRELPPRPNLEHLKKQAKDLLHAHQRGEPEALARIRAAVPAFAGKTDEEIARAPFALHDAQSAVAREYGQKSWSALRDVVAASAGAAAAPEPAPSEALLGALMGQPLPEAVTAALKEAWSRRSSPAEAAQTAEAGVPDTLPLLAMRNALLVPGALAPIHVGRASSAAAVTAALGRTPPTLAVFAQRAAETEDVRAESLHPVGCETWVHARIADGEGRAWVVLEGLRWIALRSIEPAPAGYLVAHVAPAPVERGDASEVAALAGALRARSRELARGLPDGEQAAAMLDALTDAGQLADLVIANLPVPVEDKARYAAEPSLAARLRLASELVEAQLARRGPSA